MPAFGQTIMEQCLPGSPFYGSQLGATYPRNQLIRRSYSAHRSGLMLEAASRSKRATKYAVSYGNRGSKWYSQAWVCWEPSFVIILHLLTFGLPNHVRTRVLLGERSTFTKNARMYFQSMGLLFIRARLHFARLSRLPERLSHIG